MDGPQVFLSKISPFHVEFEFAFKENLEFHPKASHPNGINRNPYQEEIGIVAQIPPLVNIRGDEVANFFPDFFGGRHKEKSSSPVWLGYFIAKAHPPGGSAFPRRIGAVEGG